MNFLLEAITACAPRLVRQNHLHIWDSSPIAPTESDQLTPVQSEAVPHSSDTEYKVLPNTRCALPVPTACILDGLKNGHVSLRYRNAQRYIIIITTH